MQGQIYDGDFCIDNKSTCYQREGTSNFFRTKVPIRMHKLTKELDNDNYAVTTVIVPKDTTIYSDENVIGKQVRAEKVFVEKQAKLNGNNITKTKAIKNYSAFDFIYETGQYVKPRDEFSKVDQQCDSGIHLFAKFNDCIDATKHGFCDCSQPTPRPTPQAVNYIYYASSSKRNSSCIAEENCF